MNPTLELLHPYPFEKLAKLKANCQPPAELAHIALSIGEPKHKPPQFVLDELASNLDKLSNYTATKGSDSLRATMAAWAQSRFSLSEGSLSADNNILPVNGTREAIFAFVQAAVTASASAKVLMPNPFYQIYEGATFLAGAKPFFLNCEAVNNFQLDLSLIREKTWKDCQLLFLCSPGNPTGSIIPLNQLQELIELADKYDFIIASDECYSELYFDETNPPLGLLEACAKIGRDNYERCVVFHSLSKRSNLPGLRSGFIAGDASLIEKFLLYRTYHGCAMPLHTQAASEAAWKDETHVKANRSLYREKFEKVSAILQGSLEFSLPDAGFYLWPRTPIADDEFAQRLFAQQNVTVLPGSYLARNTELGNPGQNRIRMALVAPVDECVEAANRIKQFVSTL